MAGKLSEGVGLEAGGSITQTPWNKTVTPTGERKLRLIRRALETPEVRERTTWYKNTV